MSDEEMEKFEITDYDLDNEFNIHRNRKRMSKHQQIYGNNRKFHYYLFTFILKYFVIIFVYVL